MFPDSTVPGGQPVHKQVDDWMRSEDEKIPPTAPPENPRGGLPRHKHRDEELGREDGDNG